MRNRLELQTPITDGITYSAAGDLDGYPADVYGYNGGRVIIGFGPATLNLTRAAAAELAQHLLAALECAGSETAEFLELFTAATEQQRGDVMRILQAYAYQARQHATADAEQPEGARHE